LNISVRIQDLLSLLWNRKLYIIGFTLLIVLISWPVTQIQHQYVTRKYEESFDLILSTKPEQNGKNAEEVSLPYTLFTVYITVSGSITGENSIAQDILPLIKDQNSLIVAFINASDQLGIDMASSSASYLFKSVNAINYIALPNMGIIRGTGTCRLESNPDVFFPLYFDALLCTVSSGFGDSYSLSWEFEYSSSIPKRIDFPPVREGNDSFMQLPDRPSSLVRVAGSAFIYGLALIVFVFLVIDFVNPVIKGRTDISMNLSVPVVDETEIESSYRLVYAGKFNKRINKIINDTVPDNPESTKIMICAKSFHTPYNKIFGIPEWVDNKDNVTILLI